MVFFSDREVGASTQLFLFGLEVSFGADLCVGLSTHFGWNLLRQYTPGVCLGPEHLMNVLFKVKSLCNTYCVDFTSSLPAVSLSKPSPIYLYYKFTESNSFWAHRVTVHVQHRWQINMNKLCHTVSMSDLLWISTARWILGYWTSVQTDRAFSSARIDRLLLK